MSIAIVAAVLACVTMLGHRADNETLRLQGEALRLQGESLRIQGESLQLQTSASMESTKLGTHWQYYATKNIFHLESRITIDLLKVLGSQEKSEDRLMPDFGRAYSTSASVTSRPIAADFAFHFSEAIRRYELPHCGFEFEKEVKDRSHRFARIETDQSSFLSVKSVSIRGQVFSKLAFSRCFVLPSVLYL